MNFKENTNKIGTVKVRSNAHPIVFISETALNKMFLFTKEITTEVGWLGSVERVDNEYLIKDVFLLKQDVHATTTEITSEGLTAFAEEIIAMEGGFELWNEIKMWGHSHVNMQISPSGQDNSQMEVFSECGHDFFIRLICNKKGELAVDVYDFEKGIEFHNAKWLINEEFESEREKELELEIKKLKEEYAKVKKEKEEIKKGKLEELAENVKGEIKEKVKQITYNKTPMKEYGNYQYGAIYSENDNLIDGKFVKVNSLFTNRELLELGVNCSSGLEMKELLDKKYPALELTMTDAYKVFGYVRKLGYFPSMKGGY